MSPAWRLLEQSGAGQEVKIALVLRLRVGAEGVVHGGGAFVAQFGMMEAHDLGAALPGGVEGGVTAGQAGGQGDGSLLARLARMDVAPRAGVLGL